MVTPDRTGCFAPPHALAAEGDALAGAVLETLADVAGWLALTHDELDWFADRKGLMRRAPPGGLHHYSYLWLPKASGGLRLLERPKARLKELQRRLLHEILARIPPHGAVHGFCGGRSVVSFAAPQSGREVVLRLDLTDFFPSVTATRVRSPGSPRSIRVAANACARCSTGWSGRTPAGRSDEGPENRETLARDAARLRKRFQSVKQRPMAKARDRGLLGG